MRNKPIYPEDDGLNPTSVVSSTECTGLIQGMPEDEEDIEEYSEIVDIPKQPGLGWTQKKKKTTPR